MFKKYMSGLWGKAYEGNYDNILSLLEVDPCANFLDLGCDDGAWTLRCASKIGTCSINGVEVVDERANLARDKNVVVKSADLNSVLPYDDSSFDAVHSNQVIEHLYDTDKFLEEITRVLRGGGYTIISTENAASWHNILSLFFGWQMFSLTNISSKKGGIGNPFALHHGELAGHSAMQHHRIFSYKGLIEYVECFGLKIEKVLCSGYYPLPSSFAKFDPRHGHFITVKARKV